MKYGIQYAICGRMNIENDAVLAGYIRKISGDAAEECPCADSAFQKEAPGRGKPCFSSEEVNRLNAVIHDAGVPGDAKLFAEILLLRYKGETYKGITEKLSVSVNVAFNCLKRYQNDGINAALYGKAMTIVLTDADRNILNQALTSGRLDKTSRKRAEILLASEKKADSSSIAEKAGCNVRTVYKCLNEFRDGGTKAAVFSYNRFGDIIDARENARLYIQEILDKEPPSGFWSDTLLFHYIKGHAVDDGHPELASIAYDKLTALLRKCRINVRGRGFCPDTIVLLKEIADGAYPGATSTAVRRAKILLLRAEGMTQREIAGELGINEQTVHRCISRMNREGLEKMLLESSGPGRPHKNPTTAKNPRQE